MEDPRKTEIAPQTANDASLPSDLENTESENTQPANTDPAKLTPNRVIKLVCLLLFFAIILCPLTFMAIIGPDESRLESESRIDLEGFTAKGWWNGSFQTNFESWFSAHYPMRSNVVRSYQQMKYRLESSAPVINTLKFITGNLKKQTETEKKPVTRREQFNAFLPETIEGAENAGDVNTPGGEDVTSQEQQGQQEQQEEEQQQQPQQQNTSSGGGQQTSSRPAPTSSQPVTPPQDPWELYTNSRNMYASMNLLQLDEVPEEPWGYLKSSRVNIGKSGYLFESAYINEYYGYTAPYNSVSDAGMQETVRRLEYIQQELKKRGITMLYIITPSKASQYVNFIPDWYKNQYSSPQGYVRPITRMRRLLANSSVNYLDSAAYYQKIGLLNTFPKTGIHWNAPAAFEATAKLLDMYAQITGQNIRQLKATKLLTSTKPFNRGNPEQDVYNILYGELTQATNRIVDKAYFAPEIQLVNPNGKKLNVFIQGGSFTHPILWNLNNTGAATATQIYYNGLNGGNTWGSNSPWEKGPEAWGDWLKGRDMVIFESNEQAIRGVHASGNNWLNDAKNGNIGHNVIYDSLYTYLKSHEGSY